MSFINASTLLSSIFPKNRMIGDIEVDVIISENTNDTLTITKQPVQQGASITDHAYKEPTTLSMSIYFKDNGIFRFGANQSLKEIYQSLIDLQTSRVPFPVATPKRIYSNMLISSLGMTTDKRTENCLAILISFQEVIIVSVSTTQVPRLKQKFPGITGKTEKAGKKSALVSLKEGLGL